MLRTTRRDAFCVVEIATWGPGTVTRAARVVAPDIAVVTNIGPGHLEALGTIEGVAAAKAELIAALRPGATLIVPAGEALLEPYLRDDIHTVTFGDYGDVQLIAAAPGRVEIDISGRRITVKGEFEQAHLWRNLLAAVAAAHALGVTPDGSVEFAVPKGRGQHTTLARGVTLIDDSYNANPMSMGAALEDLAATARRGLHSRQVAVLGDMLELGPHTHALHAQVGHLASTTGVDLLVTVGPRAAAMAERFGGEVRSLGAAPDAALVVPRLVRAGDVVLVKGSRLIGLELVCRAIYDVANGR